MTNSDANQQRFTGPEIVLRKTIFMKCVFEISFACLLVITSTSCSPPVAGPFGKEAVNIEPDDTGPVRKSDELHVFSAVRLPNDLCDAGTREQRAQGNPSAGRWMDDVPNALPSQSRDKDLIHLRAPIDGLRLSSKTHPFIQMMVRPAESTRLRILLDVKDLPDWPKVAPTVRLALDHFSASMGIVDDLLGVPPGRKLVDRDQDGILTIAFTSRLRPEGTSRYKIAGAFNRADFGAASDPRATGNRTDILWVRLPDNMSINVDMATSTMVHEYAHLVQFTLRSQHEGAEQNREAIWLQEGVAHLMEVMTGWGSSSESELFHAYMNWPEVDLISAKDSREQRGLALLLLDYLLVQRAKKQSESPGTWSDLHTAARQFLRPILSQNKVGFCHEGLVALKAADMLKFMRFVLALTAQSPETPRLASQMFLPAQDARKSGQSGLGQGEDDIAKKFLQRPEARPKILRFEADKFSTEMERSALIMQYWSVSDSEVEEFERICAQQSVEFELLDMNAKYF